MEKTDYNKYTYRAPEFYNFWRKLFQFIVTHIGYYIRFKLIYRIEVYGKENIPKKPDFIVTSNHLSTLDPALVASVLPYPVAYMTKKELFDIPIMKWWIDWLGGFAVDREKLALSTIKTVKGIKKTNWVFGIFPQGTREKPGEITKITKGFAALAKSTKSDILPVGITGTEKACHIPFTGKIIVRIGEVIPYSENTDEVRDKWAKSISELTGFKYVNNSED